LRGENYELDIEKGSFKYREFGEDVLKELNLVAKKK
jgi:hypothetical protein